MKVVLASHNKKKMVEMKTILSAMGVEVLSQADVGVDLEPEETGTTFAENAAIKAQAVMEATGLPAIADDSGLMVDALNGEPGVYSARYGGPGLDDTGRWQLLLKNMAGIENRACKFVSVICCCFPDGQQLSARGECPGILAHGGTGALGMTPSSISQNWARPWPSSPPKKKTRSPTGPRPWRDSRKNGRNNMELTSKQRAQLRGLANSLTPIVHIGKEGITEAVVKQTDEALEARELIKCRVLESALLTAREACDELAQRTRSEGVQAIGSKFVLYRQSHNKEKKNKIELVKDKKKPAAR